MKIDWKSVNIDDMCDQLISFVQNFLASLWVLNWVLSKEIKERRKKKPQQQKQKQQTKDTQSKTNQNKRQLLIWLYSVCHFD